MEVGHDSNPAYRYHRPARAGARRGRGWLPQEQRQQGRRLPASSQGHRSGRQRLIADAPAAGWTASRQPTQRLVTGPAADGPAAAAEPGAWRRQGHGCQRPQIIEASLARTVTWESVIEPPRDGRPRWARGHGTTVSEPCPARRVLRRPCIVIDWFSTLPATALA